MTVHVSVKNVSHFFKSKGSTIHALDNATFDVHKKEFVTLVGPSGCGKSTLLYLIAGLFSQTSGEISVDGAPVRGVSRNIGMVFQQYTQTLPPWRSTLKNVELGLEIRGVPKEERKQIAMKYIDLVGLKGFEDKKPYELSGGMQQRVAIARTFAYNPSILLMDEPFASVDAQTREFLQEELLKIWSKETKTVLFITHDIREATYLGERVLVMTCRPGKIKEIIKPNFPSPRWTHDVKGSVEFLETTQKIWDMIKEEVKA